MTARLFIGQLHFEATEADVLQLFSFYGPVLHVNILREGGRSTGSAFVTYPSPLQADSAILGLHDRYHMGRERPLQVGYCRRTERVSGFGLQHAKELNQHNNSNPILPVPRRGGGEITQPQPVPS